jgi:uncharacterized protein (TIGR03437 family)
MKRWALAWIAVSLGAQPRTVTIQVNADGSFTPRVAYVRSGDTVRWEGLARTDAIVSANGSGGYPAMCSARSAYDPADLTGPALFAPSGVFTLSPLSEGFIETTAPACPPGSRANFVGDNGKRLCTAGGAYEATMAATWSSPNVTGVFIRLLWKDVNPGKGVYDFTVLRRELEAAIANGKVYSLGVKAGDDGTPGWIFNAETSGGGGVPRLSFDDAGGSGDLAGCGNRMDLGNPVRPNYKALYFAMLTEVARFIKTRADWYRALAYIKISGANLISHENRLPNECRAAGTASCLCAPQIWAADGYRPSGLYAFYDEQAALLKTLFPGKAMAYALIQDGFPRVNETGGYLLANGASSNASALPDATEQTVEIMNRGQASIGLPFVVQHNGVLPKPTGCNFEGIHPKPNRPYPQYWEVGSGCPNRWAVKEGAEGQLTGFQTVNREGVGTREELDLTFQNVWDNSDGMFEEIYEDMFWLAENTGRGILPRSGKTLGQWAEDFHRRRNDPAFPNFIAARNPFPTTHSIVVAGPARTLTYIHASKCGQGRQEYGQIVVDAASPVINSGGVVTAAGFGAFSSVAPGSWIEIYGSGLGFGSRQWDSTDFLGATAPSALDGTSVRIGGQAAFVQYVSAGQVNAQVPSNVPVGTQPLTVTTPVGTSAPVNVPVNATQPGLNAPPVFRVNGRQYAAALFPDNLTFALPANAIAGVRSRPARAGETLTLYGVGFGPVTPAVAAGQVVVGANSLATPFTLSVGGVRATVSYAGLSPSAVGLYQVNFVVPAVPPGDAVPLTFTLGGVAGAQTLFVAVGN